MRKLALAVALCATALATPAFARDTVSGNDNTITQPVTVSAISGDMLANANYGRFDSDAGIMIRKTASIQAEHLNATKLIAAAVTSSFMNAVLHVVDDPAADFYFNAPTDDDGDTASGAGASNFILT